MTGGAARPTFGGTLGAGAAEAAAETGGGGTVPAAGHALGGVAVAEAMGPFKTT